MAPGEGAALGKDAARGGDTAPGEAAAPGKDAAPGEDTPSGEWTGPGEDTVPGEGAGDGTPQGGGEPSESTVPEPPERLQVRALQALCRQVFGFRLAMIVLAAPAALLNAAPGLGARLVGAAVVVTFMGSYVLFRDWERFGPLLLRHPALLAADTLFGSLLLVSAGPDTTLAYVSVCTPLLAGLVYGWRGAACFASLQSLILLLVHATLKADQHTGPAESLLLPGLCVVTGAMGSTLRNLMLRYGTATQALTAVRARLAATEAVHAERARLAREMHDSLTKTLHGVALAADALAATAAVPTPDPALLRDQASLVSRSARRAAAESRALLTDLREETSPPPDLTTELGHLATDFTTRTTLPATCRTPEALPPLPPSLTRTLLAITTEALDNIHRHAHATRVEVTVTVHDDRLHLTVRDDGRGLPPDTTLERLRSTGHFGLLGMTERAESAGGRVVMGRREDGGGTEVRVDVPLPPTTERTA
ncbi:sensor histidine kinase [Streptomyces sp. DSM 110735]|uniref:sensor histidine kinase n=1 Tax=Streptomyces sp. DSM 110735 TaxID=2775031 RepID=UPI001F5B2549|nr:ATP-binding protein [Streptomyces sp. DSM 110735]